MAGYMYNMLTCDMEFPNIDLKSVLMCFPNWELHFDMRYDHIQRKYTIPLLVHVIINYNYMYRPVSPVSKGGFRWAFFLVPRTPSWTSPPNFVSVQFFSRFGHFLSYFDRTIRIGGKSFRSCVSRFAFSRYFFFFLAERTKLLMAASAEIASCWN